MAVDNFISAYQYRLMPGACVSRVNVSDNADTLKWEYYTSGKNMLRNLSRTNRSRYIARAFVLMQNRITTLQKTHRCTLYSCSPVALYCTACWTVSTFISRPLCQLPLRIALRVLPSLHNPEAYLLPHTKPVSYNFELLPPFRVLYNFKLLLQSAVKTIVWHIIAQFRNYSQYCIQAHIFCNVILYLMIN